MKPACSYLRVSGQSQSDGDGFPRQDETIAHFAAGKFHVVNCFYESFTGTRDDRPAFVAMLDWCVASGVSVILIERMDRLARKFSAGEKIIEECRLRGLTVINCATGDVLTDDDPDPDVWFMGRLSLLMAEWDKRKTVSRTGKARRRIRESGRKCDGRKGYRDFPEWKPVVERIEKLAKNMSHEAIAQCLNQEGVKTLNGNPWKRGTIHRILKGAA